MSSRLALLLDRGEAAVPDSGPLLVIGAAGDADLTGFAPGRTRIVQRFRPDHDRLLARGYEVTPVPPPAVGEFAAVLVHAPRARAAATLAIGTAARLAAPGAPVFVEGAKTDGIDALYRAVRKRTETVGTLAKAHGRVFWFPAGPGFEDWAAIAEDWPPVGGFVTAPGVFSADAVDPASAALAAALPAELPGRVADLGAGWGYLSCAILAREGVSRLDLVEADHAALDAAHRNLSDSRARFHWADAISWTPDGALDRVVTNPPFHIGRAADPGLGIAFIETAARTLRPDGELWLVANRQLPYEGSLAERFREVREIGAPQGFKILRAMRPRMGSGRKG